MTPPLFRIQCPKAYSYYRNPSAVGVLRGQLCYNGTSTGLVQGKTTYYFFVPEATSEIMDDLMSETGLQFSGGAREDCVGAPYTELGPGIASSVAEVSWNGKTNKNQAEITLLSSTIALKDVTTKDIRCKYCTGSFVTIDGGALTCAENATDWNNGPSYSNTILYGSHLHLGDEMKDGPPPVFFCKNAEQPTEEPLSPGAGAFHGGVNPGLCQSLYHEEDCE